MVNSPLPTHTHTHTHHKENTHQNINTDGRVTPRHSLSESLFSGSKAACVTESFKEQRLNCAGRGRASWGGVLKYELGQLSAVDYWHAVKIGRLQMFPLHRGRVSPALTRVGNKNQTQNATLV